MKICIATTGPNLDSRVSPVFGRAPYFLIVNSETKEFKVIENEAAQAFRGAGIAAAQVVATEKVEVLITGMVGPNAQYVLEQSGIKIISGISGTAKEALEKFKKGGLE
jgi:predicted Fe-Mo cluster-binding NifX family protein